MHQKLSSSGIDAAFEKVTFENDASILFKHVTARRFRFVYHYHPENVQHSAEDKRRIERIYRYLSEHFREPCPVGEAAQAVAMNERTFSRFFRHETGRNYIETLLDLRLSYACRLLKESDKTITMVSYDCGFTNLANFNRQFRRRYRMTPKEYRKRWAE
jgi:AraC-like DNA-binding protein